MLESGGTLWPGRGWGRALGSWRWRGPEFWAGQMLNAQIHWAMGGGGRGRGCEGEEEDEDTLA